MKGLFAFGFNHHGLNLEERGRINLDETTISSIYDECKKNGVPELCILNTCNRTELYSTSDWDLVQHTFYRFVPAAKEMAGKVFFLKGEKALQHMMKVACGLDSQIIGDIEILGQFRTAFKKAKTEGMLGGYLERIGNLCIQAAKDIRHQTGLSEGTTSLSYAVIQSLVSLKIDTKAKIVIIGLGDLGTSIAKNVAKYFPHNPLWLTNRTEQKSETLARELTCNYLALERLPVEANSFDILVAAAGNLKNTLVKNSFFKAGQKRVFIDLSVPCAVDREITQQKNHICIGLDQLSDEVNQSLENRKKYIPAAEKIILDHLRQFLDWNTLQVSREGIRQWKNMLEKTARDCDCINGLDEQARQSFIQKSMKQFVLFLKERPLHLPVDGKTFEEFISANTEKSRRVICEQNCHLCPGYLG